MEPFLALLQWAGFILLFVASLRWGKGPERICAGVYVGLILSEVVYHLLLGGETRHDRTDPFHFAVNFVAWATLLKVALEANRIYPIWLCVFQTISVLSHAVRNILSDDFTVAYWLMVTGPSNFAIVTLAIGLALHCRRVRRIGSYRSWRASSNR